MTPYVIAKEETPEPPPTRPYDPLNPDDPAPEPIPLPPDTEPHQPVREPEQPMPFIDPNPPAPKRF